MAKKSIYTGPVLDRILFLREQCRMGPKEIAEQMSITLGQRVHRRTISEITGAHGAVGETVQYRAPNFDGWWFGDDNIEVDRWDKGVADVGL